MAQRKITSEAFLFYVSLGTYRSYALVADAFGVSKRAIVSYAKKERWQERLQVIEEMANQAIEELAQESLEEMKLRHDKLLRLIQAKAIEGLKSLPMSKASDCWKALIAVITQERLARGEPTERTEFSTEKKIEEEYANWMNRYGPQAQEECDGEAGDAEVDEAFDLEE